MKKLYVFLDNGHGCNTKGKCSPDKSILEYKWCREIVYMIYNELIKLGIPTFIVTPEQSDISLNERVRRINKEYTNRKRQGYQCILLSIHINASGNDGKWHNASGWSGWVSKNSSKNSKRMAQLLYDEAESLGLKGNRWVPCERYWQANYKILHDSNCPSVLTENMFQDNKEDVKFLLSNEGKEKIVKVHVEAIKKYIV